MSESDDEVNNQKPLTLPEEQKLKRQQSQNEQTKTYTYGDSEQNDKSNHENDLSHHTPSISDDKDNVLREIILLTIILIMISIHNHYQK